MPRRNRFLTETYNKMLTQEIVARKNIIWTQKLQESLKSI
jgi:hypothetical protein